MQLFFFSALLLELAYVLTAFVVLNTGLLANLIGLSPEHSALHIGSGWSIVPGHFELRNVYMMGRDANVRWQFELPQARADLDLLSIASREIHFRSVSAKSIDFRLTLNTPQEKKEILKHAQYIPVEILKTTRWKIRFDQIDLLSAPFLKFADFIYKSETTIHGSFYLWPGIEAEVGPARLKTKDGILTKGIDPLLAKNIAGFLDVRIDPFTLEEFPGMKVLQKIGAAAKLNAEWISPTGSLSTDLEMRKGKLTHSLTHFSSKDFHFNKSFGQGTLSLISSSSHPSPSLVLKLDTFGYGQKVKPLVRGKNLLAVIESKELELVQLFNHWNLELKAQQITAQPIKLASTQIHSAQSRVELTASNTHAGHFLANIQNLKGSFGKNQFQSQMNLKASLPRIDSDLKSIQKIRRLNIESATLTSMKTQLDREAWWFQSEFKKINIHVVPNFSISGEIGIYAKDTVPVLKFYEVTHELSSLKKKLLSLNPVEVTAQFNFGGETPTLKNIQLKAGALKAQGDLAFQDKGPLGKILGQYGLLTFGFKLAGGQTDFSLFPAQYSSRK